MSGKRSGVDRESVKRFRSLIAHVMPDAGYGPAWMLFTFAYWLNGRKAAPSFTDHVKVFSGFTAGHMGGGRREGFTVEYPELARYLSADTGGRELAGLERKAAGMFCDGLLSRPEHPAGEGWAYVCMLSRWVYAVCAGDRLTALNRRARLFTRGFRPIVTMDDMPDYPTMEPWDDRALADMNAYAVWVEGPEAAWRAYNRDRFTKWHPAYERAGVRPDRSVRTVDAVRLVLGMAEQGMKDSARIFRDWLDNTHMLEELTMRDSPGHDAPGRSPTGEPRIYDSAPVVGLDWQRRRIITDILAGARPGDVEDYSPYFKPVTGGDPSEAYADYRDRRQVEEQEGRR